MKDQEIAEILNSTLQSTKIRLHRARVRLKKELANACVSIEMDTMNLPVTGRVVKIEGFKRIEKGIWVTHRCYPLTGCCPNPI